MSRPWRIEFPHAVYHIISRGNNRREIFRNDDDREKFLALVGNACSRFNVHLFAFCLMDNHYHLFLRTPEANLAIAMHWLNTSYTYYFNRRHRRCGHLFQGRYKSVLVADESHWEHLSIYLHLNPVRSGQVDDPGDYAWSSFRDYTQAKSRFPWLRRQEILSQGGGSETQSRRYYQKSCRALAGQPASSWEEIRSTVVVGSKEVLRHLVKKHRPAGDSREVPAFAASARAVLDWEHELARVAHAFLIPPDLLKNRRRNFPARPAAYYHLVENCGARVAQVGKFLGIRPTAVSLGIRRLREKLKKDQTLRKTMEALSVK